MPFTGYRHSEETKSKMRLNHVGMLGKHLSQETKAKLREQKLGNNNPMFGKNHTEEAKAKISKGNVGRRRSEEAKMKIRKARTGKRMSEETKAKLVHNGMLGKHHSEEAKAKIGMANLGEKSGLWKGDKAKPQTGRTRANKLFVCPKGMVRHHVDGNPLNNAPENIELMTRKQHQILHHLKRG